MSKCRNEVFMSKIGVEKLDKRVEVHFDVQRDLPDCKRINASKYISTEAETPNYNRWKTPINQFECMRFGCVNSGTLFNDGKATVYKIDEEATEYSAGVITFYALAPNGGTATVKISNDAELTNSWEYSINLDDMSKGKDDFYAVIVDLAKEPIVNGDGFDPDGAFYVSIEITPSEEGVGISSIAVFDDIYNFETSAHVILGCLTSIDGTWDLEAAEDTCFSSYRGAGYNTDNLSGFEKTITGKAITPNYMLLNPLMKKGEAVKGFDMATIEKNVAELEGTDYGYITIADVAQDECGFFSAMLADKCNITDSQLDRLSIPSKIDIDEKHYQLIDNGDGGTTVLVNKASVPLRSPLPVSSFREDTGPR